MILRSELAISVLNHELSGDQSTRRSKCVLGQRCRYSTDAFIRELEHWMLRSGTLSIPLNPRLNPSELGCEFIFLACACVRPAAHGRVGYRMRKFDPTYGILGTGTYRPSILQEMQSFEAWLSGQITQAQPLTCSSEFY